MSYSIQEPEEEIKFYNNENQEYEKPYYLMYSKIQKKRFMSVLKQFRQVWFNTYKQIKLFRMVRGSEETDILMSKVYKLFFIEHNALIEFYAEEKQLKRKNKNYLSKKINKIRNTKTKL